ncbi:MAG: ATP-binding protein [Ruminococcaceae bacterium]|nr:ATP-binding protein [Oscillospiraceae bacterium]
MFIGREKELAKLNQLYNTDTFQFPVIYGRRRVGKTALINEFIKGKDAISFTGLESTFLQNLENLSKAIHRYIGTAGEAPVYPSFQSAFETIFALSEKKRLILVIDEYPYVAKAYKAISSILQTLIDKYKDTSKLYLILCGSSMSFMEEQVLGYKSPLYGRRTAQFKILPFDFSESRKYFKRFSDIDMAQIYGIVGGTPQYLLQMDDGLSVEDNIKMKILDPSSYLFEEPGNLLKQEVQKAALYNGIVTAVATGSTKLSEIAAKAGEETSACALCIKKLIALGIVRKETPYGESASKKTIYNIEDNLFRFWYRFIPDNLSLIQNDMADVVYNDISAGMSTYMGAVFEDICKQYLWEMNRRGEAAVRFTSLGRWWGNDPKKKTQTEIDIIGEADKNTALFGECKWTNEKVDRGVLELLVERSLLFPYGNVYYYMFSKSGFTKSCADAAEKMGNVALVSYNDIVTALSK